jgi:hypothetical protein
MLKIRNRADSTATPQLPLSWEDNARPADTSPNSAAPAKGAQDPPEVPDAEAKVKAAMTASGDASQTEGPAGRMAAPPAAGESDGHNTRSQVGQTASSEPADNIPGTPPETTAPPDGYAPASPLPEVVHLDEIPDKLGLQLLSLRARMGVSAAEVAAKVHAGVACVNDLEQGNYGRLPPDFFCKSLIERLCHEYDVDPEPLLELFEKESLAAGRTPSGFKDPGASTGPAGGGKPRRDPLAILTGGGVEGDEAGSDEKTPHRIIGLALGLLVVTFVILLGAAIIHQILLKRNPPPQQPAKTDMSILITPQRPTPEVLRIN